jgi:hypoxanthine phosphoribosyltransferase
MITASIGSHRFEDGPTYHYNGMSARELVKTIVSPEETTDYVNVLEGVNASTVEIQQIAAAGLVRLAIEGPDYELIPEATKVLIATCREETDDISTDTLKDPHSWDDRYLLRGSLANASIDSASVLANRRNDTEETARKIESKLDSDEGIFVIGLANGGIISAARTFIELGGNDNQLSFVRFSRYKNKDMQPNMYPYPKARVEWLRSLAEDRRVVIFDEDYTTRATLHEAVSYFAELFEKDVVGIAPVEVGRQITYDPIDVRGESQASR